MDKATIRQMMKTKRLQQMKAFSAYSSFIHYSVLNHPLICRSSMIACYVSLKDEVDTHQLIKALLKEHRVCVPKVHDDTMDFYEISSFNDLTEGHFHVLEPTTDLLVDIKNIDMMIVPMLAYDDQFNRVGYGKGYYDRYFARGYQGYKLGLAYSFQHIDHIDYDQYDIPLDEIITEKA
ncbi:MAG: 5-formyltetrahydrofolate cyclo-ligase [Erysipelotrichaceae bacterium]|nr:5-formyltetrahydrofolate cyclo-ligase [Erysipelotrichaceae bacterium]